MPLGRWGFFLDPGSFPNPRCGFEGTLIGLMGLLEERLLAASEYFLTSARSLWDVGDPGGLIRYAYLCIFFWVCLKINGKSFLYAKNRFAYFSLFSLIYAKLKEIYAQENFQTRGLFTKYDFSSVYLEGNSSKMRGVLPTLNLKISPLNSGFPKFCF